MGVSHASQVSHDSTTGSPLALARHCSSITETGFTAIAEQTFRINTRVLNYGYNSAAFYFTENYAKLKDAFARHGMDVSLDRISTDRFLEFAARAKSGRRFAMKHR